MKKAIQSGADYRVSPGGRGGCTGQASVPTAPARRVLVRDMTAQRVSHPAQQIEPQRGHCQSNRLEPGRNAS